MGKTPQPTMEVPIDKSERSATEKSISSKTPKIAEHRAATFCLPKRKT